MQNYLIFGMIVEDMTAFSSLKSPNIRWPVSQDSMRFPFLDAPLKLSMLDIKFCQLHLSFIGLII